MSGSSAFFYRQPEEISFSLSGAKSEIGALRDILLNLPLLESNKDTYVLSLSRLCKIYCEAYKDIEENPVLSGLINLIETQPHALNFEAIINFLSVFREEYQRLNGQDVFGSDNNIDDIEICKRALIYAIKQSDLIQDENLVLFKSKSIAS